MLTKRDTQFSQPRRKKPDIPHLSQVDQFVCTPNVTKSSNVIKFKKHSTIKVHIIITVEDA